MNKKHIRAVLLLTALIVSSLFVLSITSSAKVKTITKKGAYCSDSSDFKMQKNYVLMKGAWYCNPDGSTGSGSHMKGKSKFLISSKVIYKLNSGKKCNKKKFLKKYKKFNWTKIDVSGGKIVEISMSDWYPFM